MLRPGERQGEALRVLVAQIGRKWRHYAVPAALEAAGVLERTRDDELRLPVRWSASRDPLAAPSRSDAADDAAGR